MRRPRRKERHEIGRDHAAPGRPVMRTCERIAAVREAT